VVTKIKENATGLTGEEIFRNLGAPQKISAGGNAGEGKSPEISSGGVDRVDAVPPHADDRETGKRDRRKALNYGKGPPSAKTRVNRKKDKEGKDCRTSEWKLSESKGKPPNLTDFNAPPGETPTNSQYKRDRKEDQASIRWRPGHGAGVGEAMGRPKRDHKQKRSRTVPAKSSPPPHGVKKNLKPKKVACKSHQRQSEWQESKVHSPDSTSGKNRRRKATPMSAEKFVEGLSGSRIPRRLQE